MSKHKKPPAKKAAPKSVVYDLQVAGVASPFIDQALVSALLPAFGPSKFSKAEQDAAPEERRTRLVKDILPPGKHKVGEDKQGEMQFWTCTPAQCVSLANTFASQMAVDVKHNMVWGHGDPSKTGLDVDPKDIFAELDDVKWVNGRLWCSVYLNKQEAQDVKNRKLKVSVRVAQDWADGRGKRWDLSLLHVAIVDHPVVADQGPFFDLALALEPAFKKTAPTKGTKKMAITFDSTVEAINKLLPEGMSLPSTISEENFDEVLAMVIELAVGNKPKEEPTVTDPGATLGADGLPASLGNATGFAKLIGDLSNAVNGGFKTLNSRIQAIENGSKASGKKAFEDKLIELGAAGDITGALVGGLRVVGAANNWDLSILTPYTGSKVVDMGNKGKGTAKPDAPSIEADLSKPLTDDEEKAAAKMFGIKPKA